MPYKYQTRVKYKDNSELQVYDWNWKDVALDYLKDCDKCSDVEWKDIRGVWE